MTNPSGLLPMEFNVVIQLDPTEEKTAGGIIVPQSLKDREELANEEGMLVAASPHAFTYADWPENVHPPQVGQRVMFARYAGALHERNGQKYRVIKDRDVVAIVQPAPTLAAVA